MNRYSRHLGLTALVVALLASGGQPALGGDSPLLGEWRAVLASPGGELPFTLVVEEGEGRLHAYAVSAGERAPFSHVQLDNQRVELGIVWYDAEISAVLARDGRRMHGHWRRTSAQGDSMLEFRASKGAGQRRFGVMDRDPGTGAAVPDVSGEWRVTFTDASGSEPALGMFRQSGRRVTGTFLTPTGDYRFLEGVYENGVLRLSTFDGSHAFLFVARARDDGSLAGDFWSRDTYHATWVAQPAREGETVLPDAWQAVRVTGDSGRFRFAFEDLNGRLVTHADSRFRDKVVIVNLFGSWCPNCADEAPLLARWYREYRDAGLEIVGLAYEFTGDEERDRRQVRRYARRHGIDYPLLLAGTSDKADAAATLPDLDRVIAYPTTVFIGRDGRVRRIHSGFTGPGTGEHYRHLVKEFKDLIATLLAETG